MNPISWNATDTGPGIREIHSKWINDFDGEWAPIDTRFTKDGAGWITRRAGILVRCPDLASKPTEFVNRVKWDVYEDTSIAAPEISMLIKFPDARPVGGHIISGRESQIVYSDALGDGVDIVYGVWGRKSPTAEKLIVIKRSFGRDLELVSEITLDGGEFRDGQIISGDRGWSFRDPVAWYYNGGLIKENIAVKFDSVGEKIRVTKYIPDRLVKAALSANSELRTDLSVIFYPDANTETSTHDGDVNHNWSMATWSEIRGASNGTVATDSATSMRCMLNGSAMMNRWDDLQRMQMAFDLTTLANKTITDATLSIYLDSKTELLSGQSVGITRFTPSSWTGASVSDFGESASSSNRMANDKTISGMSTSQYHNFNLISTGVAAIQATVGERICFAGRLSSDIDNVEPSWATGQAQTTWGTAESANDPKLTVTYQDGVQFFNRSKLMSSFRIRGL